MDPETQEARIRRDDLTVVRAAGLVSDAQPKRAVGASNAVIPTLEHDVLRVE